MRAEGIQEQKAPDVVNKPTEMESLRVERTCVL